MQRCFGARVLLVCNADCESVGQPLCDLCGVFVASAQRACSVMSPVALQRFVLVNLLNLSDKFKLVAVFVLGVVFVEQAAACTGRPPLLADQLAACTGRPPVRNRLK